MALGPLCGGESPNPSWTPSDTTWEREGRECFTSFSGDEKSASYLVFPDMARARQ